MKRNILLLSCLTFVQLAYAQQASTDKKAIVNHIQKEQELNLKKGKRVVRMQTSYNPINLVLFVPLFIYQKLVSEQISAICEFEPSCSNFGVQSLKVLGLIKGLFLTADRLTRCNGQAQHEAQYYLIDHYTGKLIDEPSMYKIKD